MALALIVAVSNRIMQLPQLLEMSLGYELVG